MTTSPQAAATQASLPITIAGPLRTQVRSVLGHEGWPDRAAEELRANPGSIVVVEQPVPSQTASLAGFESRVVLDSAWAHNPAIPSLRALVKSGSGPIVIAHLDAPASGDITHWFFEGLLLLDALLGIETIEIVDDTADRLLATGKTAVGTALSLSVARTDTEQASIQIGDVSATRTLSAVFGDPAVALPPSITIATADQVSSPATAWETSSRGAWRLAAEIAALPERSHITDLQSFRQQMHHLALP